MVKEQLHERLRELHAQLQQLESVDEPDRKLLQQLSADIQELLEQQRDEPRQYRRLGERLTETVERLEASHPNLSLLMGQMADALSKMGI
jgi:DNA repair exonuclease SbcCD ATPase subunit